MQQNTLAADILDKLRGVIDPETRIDVVKMRLVDDLQVDEQGRASYVFRPSSPLCPIAVPLALSIIGAVKEVPGVSGQKITVVDYIQADELNALLARVLEG